MSNQIQKLSNRVLAMILAIVMVVGMIPMSVFAVSPSTVATDLSDKNVTVGEYVEFTVTTAANDDLGKMVFGYFDFNGGDWSAIESLQYKESADGNWYDLVQGTPFGPVGTGFPMADATSTFRVKFRTAGTYSFSVSMKTVEGNEELCSLSQQVTATVKPSEIDTDIAEKNFVVGTACEFVFTSIPNGHAGEYVFGKFTFSDWDAVDKLEYWGVTENQWMPLPKDVLFGPPVTGFPMTQATTRLQVTFNKAGTYTCTVALVKASDTNVVLSSIEKEITVTEDIAPVVESVSGNPDTWSQSAVITGTVSDLGGSGVQKVVYSTEPVYTESLSEATLAEGVFSFEVTENATYYVWAVDGNGNVSEVNSVVIDKIDREAPQLDVAADPDAWTNAAVTILVNVIDACDTDGVIVKYNTADDFEGAADLPLTEGRAELTVSDEYNGNYYIWAVDTAGNQAAAIVTVQIDKSAPTVIITTVPSDTWVNHDVDIEGTVADIGSGIKEVVYSTGNVAEEAEGVAELNELSYSFVVSQNGTYNIWSKDIAGNYSEISTIVIKNIDKIAPEITEVTALNNWTNKDVTVNVKVSDVGGAGVEKVVYSENSVYDESLPRAALVSGENYAFTVSKKDFNSSYYVWVVDKAGNVSAVATVGLHMDITSPTVDSIAADSNDWVNTEVTVTGAVSDKNSPNANSGIEKVVYSTSAEYIEENLTVAQLAEIGENTYQYTFVIQNLETLNETYYVWAVDKAGNHTEIPAEVGVKIDVTDPTATITIGERPWYNVFLENLTWGLYHNSSVEVKIESDDEHSQVESVYYTFAEGALDEDASWEAYTTGKNLVPDRNLVVYAKVTDKAGNEKIFSSDGVILDATPSGIKFVLGDENAVTGVPGLYNGDVKINLEVTDGEPYSGIKEIKYWVTKYGVETQSETLYSFGYDGSYDDEKEWPIVDSAAIGENKITTHTGVPTKDELKNFWSGSFEVDAEKNNGCKIIVTIQVTDNAGNVSVKQIELDIDSVAPVVRVEYFDEGTMHNKSYFDGNRTAKITVRERKDHFVEPTVTITANSSTGTVEFKPEITWTSSTANAEFGESVFTAIIEYNIDANYTFDIQVVDKAGNQNNGIIDDDQVAPDAFTVDKVAPTGTLSIADYTVWEKIVETLTFGIYSKDSFDVIATAFDETSPIKVEYCKVSGADATQLQNMAELTDWVEINLRDGEKIPAVNASEQFVIYLRITDFANHVHYVSTDGAIVENIIESSGIVLTPSTPAADNGVQDVYGYYNDDVIVDISVVDGEPYSGIKEIKYWVTADDVKTTSEEVLYSFGYDGSYDSEKTWEILDTAVEGDDKIVTHKGVPTYDMLKNSWAGSIVVSAADNNSCNVVVTVQVTDNAGNVATNEVKLDIDKTLPSVEIKYNNHDGKQHNGRYYNDDRTATILITERSHHFVEPEVYINEDVPVDAENYIHITATNGLGEKLKKEVFNPVISWTPSAETTETGETVYTATIEYNVDAQYTFEIKVKDKATNKNIDVSDDDQDAPYDFVVDKAEPEGTVTIATTAAAQTWDKILEALTFGLYDATHINVSATAKDITSPVKVEYFKATGAGAATALTTDELAATEWKLLVDNGKCVVDTTDILTVKDYEQFVMYLKLTDYAGNVKYIRSGGAILDNKNPEVEKVEPQITVTPSQQPVNGIYSTDVLVDVTVNEIAVDGVYSGLKSVTYEIFNHSVSATEPTQTGTLVGFTNENPAQTELIPDYAQLGAIKVEKEKNNSNNVEIKVIAVDNAGNRSEKSVFVKIDITAPAINVSYNNNTPDSASYYKAERTATITITERNFDAKDVKIMITNTDGVIPVVPTDIAHWTKNVGTEPNGDDTTYTATITYAADGDYTFATEYTDLAGWTCGNVKDQTYDNDVVFAGGTQNPTEFTIDKTAPVVSVSYSNNSAQNGKYFKAARTATITIVEHNFPLNDIARVVFAQTTGRGGVIPTVNWSHNGDTHIATFEYNTDGDYTFGVSMTDLAGNASADANYGSTVAGTDFVIDTIFEDMITQEGVENGVAYGHGADVIPNLKISDINLQEYEVTLVGVQKDKVIDLTAEVNKLLKKGAETVTGIFDIFETKQDLDGIYTLGMTAKDKAGNEDVEEIVFTVNRFGSVYVYEENLSDLIANGGSYVYSVDEDLVITEFNADKLVTDSLNIEITLDGRPLESVMFDVTPEINDSVQTGSSGWYQYKYTISKDNFKTDGVYKIFVSSKDATGNAPENSRYEDMGITFRVDSTLAEITSIVGLEKAIVDATEQVVKYTVYDTMGIKSIKVYVDGQIVEEISDFSGDPNNFSGEFTLTERKSAQTVRIVVEDLSGNITDTDAENFSSAYEFNKAVTVSTDFFVRWYANKPLFWGSVAGFVLVAAGAASLIAAKRKKKEEIAVK